LTFGTGGESSAGAYYWDALFKKTPDFVHNGFMMEIVLKCMEICSRNETTFSLTVWCL